MKLNKLGQAAGILGVAITIIIGTIILSIVNALTNGSLGFTGLTNTVISYVTVGLAVGLLVIAFGIAIGGKE